MAKIGYARVSKHEQNKDLQINALKAAGCEKIFTDEITGSKAERKGLNEALAYLREGDTFIVWKLDRAGRSIKHLIELMDTFRQKHVEFVSLTEHIDTSTAVGKVIFHVMAAFAEFERDLNRERTYAGLSAARARGHQGGRDRKLENGQVALAIRMYEDKSNEINFICKTLHISKSTLYRYIREEKAKQEGEKS